MNKVELADTKQIIEQAWEIREKITPELRGKKEFEAVEIALNGLDSGQLRVCEKKDGKWGPVPSGKGGRPRRDTVPVGVQVGMSGKRLLAAMGAASRMTRVAVRGAISEIWVYGDPGGSRIAVHLVRTRDADNAVVRGISQLPSRR